MTPPAAVKSAWNDSDGTAAPPPSVFAIELSRESLRKKFGVSFSEYGVESEHVISTVSASGAANGMLEPGDQIMSVNGQSAARLSHEALGLLFKKHLMLHLEVKKGNGKTPDPPTPGAAKSLTNSSFRGGNPQQPITARRGFRSETKEPSASRKTFNNARSGGFNKHTAVSAAKSKIGQFAPPKRRQSIQTSRVDTTKRIPGAVKSPREKSIAQRREEARDKNRSEPWHGSAGPNKKRASRAENLPDPHYVHHNARMGPASSKMKQAIPESSTITPPPQTYADRQSPKLQRTTPSGADRPRVAGTVALPDGKFGFSVRGGIDKMDGGVFISDVKSDGNLERDGRFGVGDEVLAINGVAVENLTHKEVIKVFRANRARVSLSVLSAKDSTSTPPKQAQAPSPQMPSLQPSPMQPSPMKAVQRQTLTEVPAQIAAAHLASTLSTEPAPAGSTIIKTASNDGFQIGDTIVIGLGTANEETVVISGFGSIL
jgi:hypothetical protein